MLIPVVIKLPRQQNMSLISIRLKNLHAKYNLLRRKNSKDIHTFCCCHGSKCERRVNCISDAVFSFFQTSCFIHEDIYNWKESIMF